MIIKKLGFEQDNHIMWNNNLGNNTSKAWFIKLWVEFVYYVLTTRNY